MWFAEGRYFQTSGLMDVKVRKELRLVLRMIKLLGEKWGGLYTFAFTTFDLRDRF